MGTRMGSNFSNSPKTFIELNGKKILEIQLDGLKKQGFKMVIIVIGYLEEKFKKEIGDEYDGLSISYVINNKFNVTGSAYSFFLTFDMWKKNKKNILMLHADIFYEESILSDFLLKSLNNENYILLDENFSKETNDEQVVLGKKKLVHSLSKGEPKSKLDVGESLGINFFTIEFMEKYYNFLSHFLHENQEINWEQSIKPFLCENKTIELFYEDIGNRLWKNINYLDDLEKAKEMYKSSSI